MYLPFITNSNLPVSILSNKSITSYGFKVTGEAKLIKRLWLLWN